jgi:hypothetical protein
MTFFVRMMSFVALAAACASVPAAQAQTSAPAVTLAAADPGLSGQLGNEDPLYIKLTYRSQHPVSFQAEGLFGGKSVPGMIANGLVPQPAGGGETLVSIAYRAGTTVDALKINVFDDKYRILTSIQVAADLSWTAAAPRDPSWYAEWVAPLKQINAERARLQAETDPQMWLGIAMMLTVPVYLVLQVWLAYAWTGFWRAAALVPLIFALPALAISLDAISRGSNLGPLPFILLAPLALFYLLVAWVLHLVYVGTALKNQSFS